ncbi:helix-turn-helix domain-containing protein [Lactococcus lactis]|uniref:helix-turn-helix domain-containing protein n=1 Tax=Lactococcus lactis TaxID=1358 RepID=UPI00288DF903|nr:helix-turn-helix domain-containing protein [Lactococcus lactis]MDT2935515.1 helix-turn-helix domain-containing protein [Lactococcus lactis]
MANLDMPTYETIQAAVNGEAWAIEKVVACYGGEIDELATIEEKQPDGSIKRVIDEDL